MTSYCLPVQTVTTGRLHRIFPGFSITVVVGPLTVVTYLLQPARTCGAQMNGALHRVPGMPRSLAYRLYLPVQTSKCTPMSNRSEGYLIEHFQQHESTGRLGTALWQSDVRPPFDTNVRISTRLAFSTSSEAVISQEAPVNGCCWCVLIKRSLTFPHSLCSVGLEQEMHSGLFRQVR
jgi:hypothetical protein